MMIKIIGANEERKQITLKASNKSNISLDGPTLMINNENDDIEHIINLAETWVVSFQND